MKYGQTLPEDVEKRLDTYVKRIKAIEWFKPASDFKREDAEKQVGIVLEAFGMKASFEWRSLKTLKDWGAARDAAWGAARSAAWGAARGATLDAAWGAAWDATLDAAWGAARSAARDAAWGAEEELVKELPGYKGRCAFLSLILLWEMGLYPIGVIEGKFVIYQPVHSIFQMALNKKRKKNG